MFIYINKTLNSLWIDSLAERIAERERQLTPPPKHPNRYTAPAVQLKKRLDILWARLRYERSDCVGYYRSPWYLSPSDAFSIIVVDYDKMLTDIYTHLSYLNSLNQYTSTVTHNRGYYCRKRSQIRLALLNRYFPQSYSMRWPAWEWFFTNPHKRPPLNTFLFNYLISLQDDTKKWDFHTMNS